MMVWRCLYFIFFFKQKTAYEMRISDWSSDVCSSDLAGGAGRSADERASQLRDPRRPADAARQGRGVRGGARAPEGARGRSGHPVAPAARRAGTDRKSVV